MTVAERRRALMAFVIEHYYPEPIAAIVRECGVEVLPAAEAFYADGTRLADLDRVIDEGSRIMFGEATADLVRDLGGRQGQG